MLPFPAREAWSPFCRWRPACLLCVTDLCLCPPGELKTLQPLDREEQEEHRFKMRAVDGGGRYCEADIHVVVEDVNDNLPQFSADLYTVTVFENTEIGTYVAKLLANDVDVGELYQFILQGQDICKRKYNCSIEVLLFSIVLYRGVKE